MLLIVKYKWSIFVFTIPLLIFTAKYELDFGLRIQGYRVWVKRQNRKSSPSPGLSLRLVERCSSSTDVANICLDSKGFGFYRNFSMLKLKRFLLLRAYMY